MSITIKRVYDDASPDDGYRMLVDRLWPRGLKKEALEMDEWAKELAPSSQLRKAFHNGDVGTAEFRERYLAELDGNPDLDGLRSRAADGPVTLLIAARDVAGSHAHILIEAADAG